jgi:hypothetical protein
MSRLSYSCEPFASTIIESLKPNVQFDPNHEFELLFGNEDNYYQKNSKYTIGCPNETVRCDNNLQELGNSFSTRMIEDFSPIEDDAKLAFRSFYPPRHHNGHFVPTGRQFTNSLPRMGTSAIQKKSKVTDRNSESEVQTNLTRREGTPAQTAKFKSRDCIAKTALGNPRLANFKKFTGRKNNDSEEVLDYFDLQVVMFV